MQTSKIVLFQPATAVPVRLALVTSSHHHGGFDVIGTNEEGQRTFTLLTITNEAIFRHNLSTVQRAVEAFKLDASGMLADAKSAKDIEGIVAKLRAA